MQKPYQYKVGNEIFLIDCSSAYRKKRAASTQTQYITLTMATADKFDIASLIELNQSKKINTFIDNLLASNLYFILIDIFQYIFEWNKKTKRKKKKKEENSRVTIYIRTLH